MTNSLLDYLKPPGNIIYESKNLNDQIAIKQISELIEESKLAKENNDINKLKSNLNNISSKIESLSPEYNIKFNNALCILPLELIELLLNDHQLEEAINQLETTMKLETYDHIESTYKCLFMKYLSYSKLYLGLNTGSWRTNN